MSAQMATAMEADLLVLLSDVDGVFTGPPELAGSRLMRTYYPSSSSSSLTFWGKSSVGRGGMESKVLCEGYITAVLGRAGVYGELGMIQDGISH